MENEKVNSPQSTVNGDTADDSQAPFFNSWNASYAVLIGFLILQIFIYSLLTYWLS